MKNYIPITIILVLLGIIIYSKSKKNNSNEEKIPLTDPNNPDKYVQHCYIDESGKQVCSDMPLQENFSEKPKYHDVVSCDKQSPPQGYEPSDPNIFEKIDRYGYLLPGRINVGRAQCISNPQNNLVCDSNMYERWYWFDTMKVGYPSRDLFAYEGPNPILTVRPRYRGDDPTNKRRYYD